MFIHVAVPVPNLDLLTYRVPDGVAAPAIGARVVVPLGTRVVTGIVVDVDVAGGDADATEPTSSRSGSVLDAEAFVPPDVVELARWTAEYYAAGVGETITAAAAADGARRRAPMRTRRRAWPRSRRRAARRSTAPAAERRR